MPDIPPLLFILLAPLLLGLVVAVAPVAALGDDRRGRALTAITVSAVVLGALAALLSFGPAILAGQVSTWSAAWIPEAGISISLRLDALAFLFCFLILGVGVLIVAYAYFYLHAHDRIDKFYATLVVFMFAMLGIALSDNLILLIVFWELTSLSSFFLIGYWNRQADSRRSARVALAVTGGGGLALIAGAVLLGEIGGTFEISSLVDQRAAIVGSPLYPAALALVLLGAFTKSAQFPFHFWLPAAMAAPTPVSAYLHSATMVKAGLLLVARLTPVIGGTELFTLYVAGAGLITLVFAAATAMFKHDLKGLLAYSTVSHLGIIMFLLGLGTPMATVAAVFHILNHAAFKAALFMSAGIIDHEAGTRDIRRLGGLWRFMPVTMVLASIAAAAMAGVPPLNGFVSKEMFFEQALASDGGSLLAQLAPGAVTVGGAFSVAYSLRYIHDTFFNGKPRDVPGHPHDPPWGMRAPVLLLALICIAVGLAPALLAQPLVRATAQAIVGPTLAIPEFHLAVWHGFNAPLVMSLVAISGGVLLYLLLLYKFHLHSRRDDLVSARRIFELLIDRLIARAVRATAAIDRGSLQRTLGLLFGATLLAVIYALWHHASTGGLPIAAGEGARMPADAMSWVVWLMVVVSALATVACRRDHVLLVILTAIVGLGSVLGFVRFSAPDLALTQLAVEVVSTLLLFMGLALLPQRSERQRRHSVRRAIHGVIAVVSGLGIGWIAYAAMTRPAESIAWYFMEKSVPEGGGRNVVNVILVDFRGFDTMGEITVLGLAALGVFALLDGLRLQRAAADPAGRAWFAQPYPLMLRVVAGWMLPLSLMVALYIFLRGHNAPGGGFIAGLVASVALLTQYIARGLDSTESLLPLRYDRTIGLGLLIAASTGLGSFFLGYPFLTSASGHPVIGWLGEVGLASAALFDLGVFLVVVGGTLLTVVTLGRVSGARPDTPSAPVPVAPAGLARDTR